MPSYECRDQADLYPDHALGQVLDWADRDQHTAAAVNQGVITKEGVSFV